MYTARLVKEERFLVSLFFGHNTEEDYLHFFEKLEGFDAMSPGFPGGIALHILVVEQPKERPDARWRARLAQVRAQLKTPRPYGALVTDSLMIRGVLRVVQWLTPPPPKLALTVHDTFESAARWAESLIGPMPSLRGAYRAVK